MALHCVQCESGWKSLDCNKEAKLFLLFAVSLPHIGFAVCLQLIKAEVAKLFFLILGHVLHTSSM